MKLENQHIVSLQIENVKKITAAQINIDEKTGTVILSGQNSAGKSSVIDAIAMALRGKSAIPEKPIKEGKEAARIILETEDIIVKRKITETNAYLEITNKDGAKYPKPQEILDNLVSMVGFDPLDFAKLPKVTQTKELLKVLKTGFNLDDNLVRAKKAEEVRRDANKKAKQLESNLNSIVTPSPETPIVELLISDIGAKIKASQEKLEERDKLQNDIQLNLSHRIQGEETINALDDKLDNARILLNYHNKIGKELTEKWENIDSEKLELGKTTAFKQMSDIQEINKKIREKQRYHATKKEVEIAQTDAQFAAENLQQIRNETKSALSKTEMPIAGLSIGEDGELLFDGVPLLQCSTSEQIKIGVALAIKANSGLRVIFIKDGSLLDSSSMLMIKKLALENDLQIWIERVEDLSPGALQIIDGAVTKLSQETK